MARLRALGMINVLGRSLNEIALRLFQGDQSHFSEHADYIPGRSVLVGRVPDPLPRIPDRLKFYRSRISALLYSCIEQIEPEVAALQRDHGSSRIGVVVGSSTSGIEEGERALASITQQGRKPDGYHYAQQEMGGVSEFIARSLNIRGPAYTVSTACSSSAKVFRSAQALLSMGLCDAVIVGGADSLCRLTVNGFAALELLSPSVCNPFSQNRSGITIGEGAALFVMTREKGGVQLLGVGESSDAYHISAPDPEARGARQAITDALAIAGKAAQEIHYVNLHGTGTVHNDSMEAKAIADLFPAETPCSSTKPLVGHMLGASGATEIGFCWMSLQDPENRLPPHCWDGVADVALPKLNLISRDSPHRAGATTTFLSNSFGFGGSNCAVVIERQHGN